MATPITETIPNISAYGGTIPNKATQTPVEFADNVYPFHLYYNSTFISQTTSYAASLNILKDQINIVLGEVETFSTNAEASATSASNSATIASAAANYKGLWAAGYNTTGYSQGMSVGYSDGYNYISNINNNLTEPTTKTNTAEWNWIEAVDPTTIYTKTESDNKFNTILSSSYNQLSDTSVASGTYTFDYALGDMQQVTAIGDFTLAFSNFVTGKVCVAVIDAVNWGDHTITLPVGLLFANNTLPTFTSGGTDRLIIIKDRDEVYQMTVIKNLGVGA